MHTSITSLLGDIVKGRDQGRENGLATLLVESNDLGRALGDALGCQLELGVHLVVRTRGTPGLEPKVIVRVGTPAKGRIGFDRHDGRARREDGKLVVGALGVENLETGKRDETGFDALVLELGDRLVTKANFGPSRHEGNVGCRQLGSSKTHHFRPLPGRNHPWQPFRSTSWRAGATDVSKSIYDTYVLARKGEHGRSVLREDGDEVRGRGLVAVGGTPEGQVGEGTEPSSGLDRLVGWAVFTETDRVVSGDVEHTEVGQGRQTDGAGSVRDKVEECRAKGDDATVSGETVADGSHAVLTHTESEVAALV